MARSDSPSVSVSRRGSARGDADCTIVWVRGEHDITTKVTLFVTVARAARLDDVPLLVDLSSVTFMDASTLGAIVGSRNRLRSRAQSLEVRAPSPPALRILELCGLGHLVHRDPLRAPGMAAALGTWVDVPPIEPRRGPDSEASRAPARPAASQPVDELADARVQVQEAATTVDVARGGP